MVCQKTEPVGMADSAEREWFVQRIGWVLWAGIILAALLGMVGPGPLSTSTATSSDGSTAVSYNKYLHYHSPETLEITLRLPHSANTLSLFVSRTLLDSLEIRRTEPEPAASILAGDGLLYNFPVDPSAETVKVVLHVEYQKFGSIAGEISLGDRPPARVNQFVYP